MSPATAMRLTQLHGEPESALCRGQRTPRHNIEPAEPGDRRERVPSL